MPDLTPSAQNNGSTQLYAKWTASTYNIAYNKNGGSGTMASSIHTYDIDKNLSANSFTKVGHDFIGWATSSSGSVVYTNKQSVKNLTINAGTVTLYAVWQAKTYNIIYKNLMPNMSVYPSTYTYGEGLTTMPIIYLTGGYYTSKLDNFYGWYTTESFTTKVTSISATKTGDVVLYAKYDYYISSTCSYYTHTVKDGNINNQPSHSVDLFLDAFYYDWIKNTTLSKIKIEFSMNIWEVDDGYQDIYLYNGNSVIWSKIIEHGPGKKDTNARNYTFTIELDDVSDYKNLDFLDLKFGAHGSLGDTWRFDNFEMSIYFTN